MDIPKEEWDAGHMAYEDALSPRADIGWACKWVGWHEERMPEATSIGLNYYIVPGMEDAGPIYRTDADLAEAVRSKFYDEWLLSDEAAAAEARTVRVLGRIKSAWLAHGPLAFIKAVREVIGAGP